jgi:hypothetical protein
MDSSLDSTMEAAGSNTEPDQLLGKLPKLPYTRKHAIAAEVKE